MKKVFWIVCYQYYENKQIVKGNTWLSDEVMECNNYQNPLDAIIEKSNLKYKDDVIILSVSKVEMTVPDPDASRW